MPPKKNRKATPATARRRRNKANPDEYRREGLVTVDHDSFSAMLFAPQELKTIEQTSPYMLYQNRSDTIQEKYIVQVRRIGAFGSTPSRLAALRRNCPARCSTA